MEASFPLSRNGVWQKSTFCTDRVAFLGYVVTPWGIEVDEVKIQAIKN
jgi:hypothetical protein